MEIKGNILIAFDTKGNQLIKRFNSPIVHHVIDDIDEDGSNDLLLGFAAQGKDHSRVMAFDSKLIKKWHYIKEPNYPYLGAKGGRFNVNEIKVFQEKNRKIVAVLFIDSPWYPSALVVLNQQGKKLKEFWHPGHLIQIERIKDVFVIRGINNDLRQTSISKNPGKNFYVVFGLTYEHIYGEAPPYYGTFKKNRDIRWYYVLSDQTLGFGKMVVQGDKIRVSTTCGMMFYFKEHGALREVGRSDGYSCKPGLHLLTLFTRRPEKKE